MNKRLIRLTESDLHRIVKESVNNIISNSKGYDDYIDVKYNETKNKLISLLSEAYQVINAYENEFGQDAINYDNYLSNVQRFLKQLQNGV